MLIKLDLWESPSEAEAIRYLRIVFVRVTICTIQTVRTLAMRMYSFLERIGTQTDWLGFAFVTRVARTLPERMCDLFAEKHSRSDCLIGLAVETS
jgi:hypothetical protein